jgi:hypothetical protein
MRVELRVIAMCRVSSRLCVVAVCCPDHDGSCRRAAGLAHSQVSLGTHAAHLGAGELHVDIAWTGCQAPLGIGKEILRKTESKDCMSLNATSTNIKN